MAGEIRDQDRDVRRRSVTGVTRPDADCDLSVRWPEDPEPGKCGAEPDHDETPRPDVDEDVLRSRLDEVRYQRAADESYGETLQDDQPSSGPHRGGWIPIHATPRLAETISAGVNVRRQIVTGVTKPIHDHPLDGASASQWTTSAAATPRVAL